MGQVSEGGAVKIRLGAAPQEMQGEGSGGGGNGAGACRLMSNHGGGQRLCPLCETSDLTTTVPEH